MEILDKHQAKTDDKKFGGRLKSPGTKKVLVPV
jgi:hypothetical protein